MFYLTGRSQDTVNRRWSATAWSIRNSRSTRKYRRWQREAPTHLWQLDLVGGVPLADGRECTTVTGIDDHFRFVVIAAVAAVPSGRAVCSAFTAAMRRYGLPFEVLSDNGKQFTGRHIRPQPVEVLSERVCRENGINQRLTKPRSPTTTGKNERFHKTLRRELLDHVAPFESPVAARLGRTVPRRVAARRGVRAGERDGRARRAGQPRHQRPGARRLRRSLLAPAPCDGSFGVFTAEAAGEESVHGSVTGWLAVTGTDPHGRPWSLLLAHGGAIPWDPWFVRVRDYPGVGASLAWSESVILDSGDSAGRTFRAVIVDERADGAAQAERWLRLAGASPRADAGLKDGE